MTNDIEEKPDFSQVISAEERAAIIATLAHACMKNQTQQWVDLMVECAVELMTHHKRMPGPWLTATARKVIKYRYLLEDPRYVVTTPNAWVSAIGMIMPKIAVIESSVRPDTLHSHQEFVKMWRSLIYAPHLPKPDWWSYAMHDGELPPPPLKLVADERQLDLFAA